MLERPNRDLEIHGKKECTKIKRDLLIIYTYFDEGVTLMAYK